MPMPVILQVQISQPIKQTQKNEIAKITKQVNDKSEVNLLQSTLYSI